MSNFASRPLVAESLKHTARTNQQIKLPRMANLAKLFKISAKSIFSSVASTKLLARF